MEGSDRAVPMTLRTILVLALLATWVSGASAQMESKSETKDPKFNDAIGSGAVDVQLYAIFFGQGFVTGNAPSTVFTPGRFDVVLNIDGEKAGLWKGFSIESRLMYRFGDDFAVFRGGALAPPNTVAAIPLAEGGQIALTDLAFRQSFNDKVILEVGRRDHVGCAYGYGMTRFWNASLASPVIHAITTPPVVPLGVGLTFVGTKKRPTVLIEAFDSRNTPTTSGLDDLFSEGATLAAIVKQDTSFWNKDGWFAFRAAYTSKETTDFSSPLVPIPGMPANPTTIKGSWEWTLDYNQSLGQAVSGGWKATTFFANIGFADPKTAPFQFAGRVLVRGTSPLANGDRENWGVGFFYNRVSDDLKNSVRIPTTEFQNEFGLTGYFDWDVTSWFTIGANAQVIQPGLASFTQVPGGPILESSGEFGTDFILGLRAYFNY